ncbi:MAG: zinc transporter ZupT [Ruminococcus sp.]|jgi:ZIP family zinc transporter|nr:zinc transporter ZupT [Ruminococcus sp.]
MNILPAFLMTLIAGLSTGLGGVISVLSKKQNTKFLAAALGFSAGVMIYVSMAELFVEARLSLGEIYGAKKGMIITVIAFFAGMILIAVIDKLIPEKENPHEFKHKGDTPMFDTRESKKPRNALVRTGLMTALALTIHNFPEGLATFIAALHEPGIAIPVTAAIALHNIPEGVAVAMPLYFATGNRKKALGYSFLSGLSEPLGAIIGYFLLRAFIGSFATPRALFGIIFAAVAGIMVFISIDELLPSAREYGEHHISIYGFVAGMAVMATSLILFM